MQVIVDDLLINYVIEGDGETVLMLHGWGDNLDTFNDIAQKLSSTYKVIRVDVPGFGKSDSPKSTYNLQSYANFIKSFLDKISINTVYATVGHSNGGAIAIKALSNNYIQCEKLILLASSGVRNNLSSHKKLIRITAKTAKIPTKLLPKKYQKKLRRKVYDKIGSDMFIAEDMQDTFKQIIAEDLVAQASKITSKTLLIYGELDTATPIEYGEKFQASIPNSKLETVPGVGHFVHHENARIVEDLIKDFLYKS